MKRGRGWRWVIVAAVALAVAGYVVYGGGRVQHAGTPHDAAVPQAMVAQRAARQQKAQGESRPPGEAPEQILFGDLHVHSTFSADAFMRSLPLMGGMGAHPPADACDFARYCSSLDFFAMTDHAESLTPRRWAETKKEVRQCNAVAGEGPDPDLVVFTGFEWTQVGATPAEHYGHKNVIFRYTDEAHLPARPIAAPGFGNALRSTKLPPALLAEMPLVPILDFPNRDRYMDFIAYRREMARVDRCPSGVDTRKLPRDCFEVADDPQELFEKLGQWGYEAMVIPHGTTWGFYTPPGYTWDKQLDPAQDDPDRQRLIEVMSGHGNSEQYEPFRAVESGSDGQPVCPAPTRSYEPCCWRAGEIIRSRCSDPKSAECERRVAKAQQDYLAAGVSGFLTVPGATVADWKDCGQCRDCFIPSFNYRPGGSVQYILAKGWFGPGHEKDPRHAMFGFIASSDNHSARPGTGYKEVARKRMTETTGPISEAWRDRIFGPPPAPAAESIRETREDLLKHHMPWQLVNLERQNSFFMTGGLVAVHARGRSRDAIWNALKRRDVYGTSGPRILLWFDMVTADGRRFPMGSAVPSDASPHFEVRAVGSFAQKPGCPAWTEKELGRARIANLCAGECYNPSDHRLRITRIEVVRIRPQRTPDEDVGSLIDDVWKTFRCPPGHDTCTVQFDDPDFAAGRRDVLYYVRAIQEPTEAINAGGVRCEYDAQGRCIKAHPCYGDYRTPASDQCLTKTEERAWSSPIWVQYAPAAGGGAD